MSQDPQLRERAKVLAKALLNSDEKYLDRILELSNIGDRLYGQCWDSEFHIFGVIASETDHLPTSKSRLLWSESSLVKTDGALEVTIETYRQHVGKACNEILRTKDVV